MLWLRGAIACVLHARGPHLGNWCVRALSDARYGTLLGGRGYRQLAGAAVCRGFYRSVAPVPLAMAALSLDGRRGTECQRCDLEAFVAMRGVLHDLGRDLAAISYLVELVRGGPELGDTTRHRLDVIEREMKRLIELVRDKVVQRPQPEILSIRPILERIISLATISHDAQVHLLPGDDVRMRIDGSFLWRMVGNVLDNAIRAAGPRGHVQVTVNGGRDVIIEVIDDGPGFGRASNGRASLGLGIVTELARACGGDLHVLTMDPLGTRAQLTFAGLGVETAEGP